MKLRKIGDTGFSVFTHFLTYRFENYPSGFSTLITIDKSLLSSIFLFIFFQFLMCIYKFSHTFVIDLNNESIRASDKLLT